MTTPEDNCGVMNHRAMRRTNNVITNHFKSKLSRSNTHEGINQKDASNKLATHISHHPSHPTLKQCTQPHKPLTKKHPHDTMRRQSKVRNSMDTNPEGDVTQNFGLSTRPG